MVIVCSVQVIRAMQKEEEFCIYCKETLELKIISISHLNESHFCKVTIRSKQCITGTVYRTSSQYSDEYESFLSLQDISNCKLYLT